MSRTTGLRLLPVAAVLAVAVACSSPSDGAARSDAAPTAPSGPNDVGADLPSPSAYPLDDAASRAAAEGAAMATMGSFLRSDLAADQWLRLLSSHLTADAAAAYCGTDPLEVPARAITGPPRWDGSTSAYLADVVVPTDVGDYRLLLVREGQDFPWLVQEIDPPDGVA